MSQRTSISFTAESDVLKLAKGWAKAEGFKLKSEQV
jgi:hypothetical protein